MDGTARDILLGPTQLIGCVSFQSPPTFSLVIKVGLGISQTNSDSEWNPVYNAFHRIFCCENKTIHQ